MAKKIEQLTALVSSWRDDWLSKDPVILSWDDLRHRKNDNGDVEQNFWRADTRSKFFLNDQQLTELGALVADKKGKLYHLAYLPWSNIDQSISKDMWGDEEWGLLNEIVKNSFRANYQNDKRFNWSYLTIPAKSALNFFEHGLTNSHIIGDLSGRGLRLSSGNSNLIDGDFDGISNVLEDAVVLGNIRLSGGVTVRDSKLKTISLASQGPAILNFENYYIDNLKASGEFEKIVIINSTIHSADLSRTDLKSLSVTNHLDGEYKIGLHLADAVIAGRCHIHGMKLSSEYKLSDRNFEHAKFGEKLRISDSDFDFSILADVELGAPIDIDPDGRKIEDRFERELREIKFQLASRRELGERRRRRLERACQLICERHRADGRKDKMQQFRRLELKARAYRADADVGTRFLTRCYDFFSNFGKSFSRPVRGLFLIWLSFFLVYWGIAASSLNLPILEFNWLDRATFIDAALLTTEKTFPFGASVDEAELFGSKVVGENGGASAFFIGILGAIQTIMSGIMLFLAGLAIRTKLLIG